MVSSRTSPGAPSAAFPSPGAPSAAFSSPGAPSAAFPSPGAPSASSTSSASSPLFIVLSMSVIIFMKRCLKSKTLFSNSSECC